MSASERRADADQQRGKVRCWGACRAQNLNPWPFSGIRWRGKLLQEQQEAGGGVIGWGIRGIVALCRPKAGLMAENLLLRQQLLILQRKRARPRPKNSDRLFWILASRVFSAWRESLLIVKPETVLRWHRKGWSA